jgi:hypothetical protein
MYLTLPETKGRSIEELEEVFNSPNPLKTSLQKKVVILKEGEGIKSIQD